MLQVRSIRNSREIPGSPTIVGDSFVSVSRYDFWKSHDNSECFEVRIEKEPQVIEGISNISTNSIYRTSVGDDWKHCAIALRLDGGLGDALIISSVVKELKKIECYVIGVCSPERAIFFKNFIAGIDDFISDEFVEDVVYMSEKFDVVLDPFKNIMFFDEDKNKWIQDRDYYALAWDECGLTGRRISPVEVLLADYEVSPRLLSEVPVRRPLIALHAGATNPDRRWDNGNWKCLADLLIDQGFGIIWLGSKPLNGIDWGIDEPPFQRRMWSLNAHIQDQAKILNTCSYFIGTDSGWAHFAGCLNIPGTAIFSATDPNNVISHYGKMKSIKSMGDMPLGLANGLCNEYKQNANNITPNMVFNTLPPRLLEMAKTNIDKVTPSFRSVQPSARQNLLCFGDKKKKVVSDLSVYMDVQQVGKLDTFYTYPDADIIMCPEGTSPEEWAPSIDYAKTLTVLYQREGKSIALRVPRFNWKETVKTTEELRKALNYCSGRTWPERVQKGEIHFVREEGLGDLILASPVYRKMREMFPEANFCAVVKGAMADILAESDIFDQVYDTLRQSPPHPDLSIYATYYGAWEGNDELTHAAEAMGGDGKSLFVEISEGRLHKVKQEIANFADGNKVVGLMPYQAPASIYKCKQLPESTIQGVIEFCNKQGWKVVQLGAPFERKIDNVDERFVYKDVLDSIASFKAVDCVITIDCYAQHACAAIGQDNCVVVWGGSGSPKFLGYEWLKNVITDCSSRCWASVCALSYKSEACCGGPKSGSGNDVTRCMEKVAVSKINKVIKECLSPN